MFIFKNHLSRVSPRFLKVLIPFSLITLLLVLSTFIVSCSANKILRDYSNDFVTNFDKETTACTAFADDCKKADIDTENGIYSFQKTIPNHLQVFNGFLVFYQKPLPSNAPQELKEAMNNAKDGTSNIIAGITMINTALTTKSNEQLASGQKILFAGFDLLDSSSTKYNSYAAAANAQAKSVSTPSWGLGIILGTALIWLTTLAIVNPATKYFVKRKLAYQAADVYNIQMEQETPQISNKSYTRIYVATSVVVFAVVGFLVGRTTGFYFIGLSWRWRDWPGLIAFIGFSLLGSYLH